MELVVPLLEQTVAQRVEDGDYDASFRVSEPIAGQVEFPLRLVRPDNSVADALRARLLGRTKVDPAARRRVAAHLLGLYLNPERVLVSRNIGLKDLLRGKLLHLPGNNRTEQFEALVARCVPDEGEVVQLGEEMVAMLLDADVRTARDLMARCPALDEELIEVSVAEHEATYARVRQAKLEFNPSKRQPLESRESHRIRQLLSRRVGGDRDLLRAMALRYTWEGESIHAEANAMTLAAMMPMLSVAEQRAFAFFFQIAPHRGTDIAHGFDGIIGYQPMLNALTMSPSALSIGW